MANELLDFVMSLVRDPDAAARYAEDPQQAIADADLTGVTSADVNNLIPVVSESLSMTAPVYGADAAADANVWSSGAATAAFDAFSDDLPTPVTVDTFEPVIDQPTVMPVDTGADLPTYDAGLLEQPVTATEFDVHDVTPAVDSWPGDPAFDDVDPAPVDDDTPLF